MTACCSISHSSEDEESEDGIEDDFPFYRPGCTTRPPPFMGSIGPRPGMGKDFAMLMMAARAKMEVDSDDGEDQVEIEADEEGHDVSHRICLNRPKEAPKHACCHAHEEEVKAAVVTPVNVSKPTSPLFEEEQDLFSEVLQQLIDENEENMAAWDISTSKLCAEWEGGKVEGQEGEDPYKGFKLEDIVLRDIAGPVRDVKEEEEEGEELGQKQQGLSEFYDPDQEADYENFSLEDDDLMKEFLAIVETHWCVEDEGEGEKKGQDGTGENTVSSLFMNKLSISMEESPSPSPTAFEDRQA